MNPVEAFLIDKVAAPDVAAYAKRMGGHFGGAVLGGLSAGIGTAVISGGVAAATHIHNAATAKRDFRQMLEWNQDLHGEDQRLLNQSFRTLRNFAPDISKDPLVAGALIRRMVQAQEGSPGIIQEAISAQKGIPTPVRTAFDTAVTKGMTEGVRGMSSWPYEAELAAARESARPPAFVRPTYQEGTRPPAFIRPSSQQESPSAPPFIKPNFKGSRP